MDLQPEPLKKEIFDKARELGITEIHLEFQGGNDEGYVYVNCVHPDRRDFHALQQLLDMDISSFEKSASEREPRNAQICNFQREIEDWVWQAYDYSGAGDGTDYGDNITYKIVEAVFSDGAWKIPTTSQDWYHCPEYGEEEGFEMGLQSQENEA